jgi:hypothetical protein
MIIFASSDIRFNVLAIVPFPFPKKLVSVGISLTPALKSWTLTKESSRPDVPKHIQTLRNVSWCTKEIGESANRSC